VIWDSIAHHLPTVFDSQWIVLYAIFMGVCVICIVIRKDAEKKQP
jgi:hypothetical protein